METTDGFWQKSTFATPFLAIPNQLETLYEMNTNKFNFLLTYRKD